MTINSNFDQVLISACDSLQITDIKTAIQNGANVNAVGEYNKFPLLACVEYQEVKESNLIIEILNLLLENGADINLQINDNETALIHSAWLLHSYEVVEFLLNKGANPNLKFDGETALDLVSGEISYYASCSDDSEVVEVLKRIYELIEKYHGQRNKIN